MNEIEYNNLFNSKARLHLELLEHYYYRRTSFPKHKTVGNAFAIKERSYMFSNPFAKLEIENMFLNNDIELNYECISRMCNNTEIYHVISLYINHLDWNWNMISYSCNNLRFLEMHIDKIKFYYLSTNSNLAAIQFIEKYYDLIGDCIYWDKICDNPYAYLLYTKDSRAIKPIEKPTLFEMGKCSSNISKVMDHLKHSSWKEFCVDSNAILYILNNRYRIIQTCFPFDINSLSHFNMFLVETIEKWLKFNSKKYFEKYIWDSIVEHLKLYRDKISNKQIASLKYYLSKSFHMPNMKKDDPKFWEDWVDWSGMFKNQYAIDIIVERLLEYERFKDNNKIISLDSIAKNRHISYILKRFPWILENDEIRFGYVKYPFELDLNAFKKNRKKLHKELVMNVFHPNRMMRYLTIYDNELEYLGL